jgi:S1-C subfamily serine protease
MKRPKAGAWVPAGGCALVATLLAAGAIADSITDDELSRVREAEAARIRAVEKVYGSVVAIYPKSRRGGGSGVVIDEEGFLLTNNHVMQPVGEEGLGGLSDGKLYKLTLVGLDPGGDIAVSRLHGKPKFDCSALGDSDTVSVGDWCLAMGNPFVLAEDQKPTVTLGVVSGINRYQGGRGNIGVYGNCLQFDTSINPGNSGGPLYNLETRLVGINGRGSFEERGRVNVGLGYAISINQIKRFLPDLRAAKVCMHGTLDATFGDRDGKVICEQVNLDAQIAKLGLELSDRLVSFDGHPIHSANQFASLISTYPAKWPVQIAFEHEGRVRSVWMRLRPLPYEVPQRPQPTPRPAGTRPATGPVRLPPGVLPTTSAVRQTKPGEIRDMKLNQEECERIFAKWRGFSAQAKALGASKAIQTNEEIWINGAKAGAQRVLAAADGRFRIEIVQAYPGFDAGSALGFDGAAFWEKPADGPARQVRDAEARRRSEVAQSLCLAALQQDHPLKAFKEVVLEGGDRVLNQIAFRVRLADQAGNRLACWLSLLGPDGTFQTRLLKIAMLDGSTERDPMWTCEDYRPVGPAMVAHTRRLVKGLAEETQLEARAVSCQIVDIPANAFGVPDAPAR